MPSEPYVRLRRRRLWTRILLVGLLLGAAWWLWSSRRPPEGLSEEIDRIVQAAMEDGPITAVSVGVFRGGQSLHTTGYGYADVPNRLATGTGTVFKIGSITKQFTAAAILQLERERALSLDDPVRQYVPEYTGPGADVSLRRLLNHTAGVPNFTTMPEWWETSAVEMPPEELVTVFADHPLDFRPGAEFSYSNSGYVLLGLVVERASGQPYGGYLNEHLLIPLGLTRTSYCDDRALVPDRARGYQIEPDSTIARARYVSMSQAYAAGGLCSNVGDLGRWTRLLTAGAVLERDGYRRMIRPDTLLDGQRLEYGYGLSVGSLEGARRISHLGGMRGFASFLSHYPESGLTIAVLTNTEGAAAASIESEIARHILRLGEQTTRDIPLDEDELAAYVGSYDMRFARVTLEIRDGRLHAVIPEPGIEDSDLLYQGDAVFQAADDPETSVHFTMEDGRAVGFTLEHQGITLTGRRLAEP